MSASISGQYGTVTVGATDMDVTDFSLDFASAQEIDVTTTADAGWEAATGYYKKVSGSFNFLYNPTKSPTKTPGLIPNATVNLSVLSYSGETYAGPAMVTSVRITSSAKDAIRGSANFRSNGTWTYPT
jgi:hypothetical protein